MRDPHLNIFHAYRGPSVSDEGSIRQLEDNLTRSLIITLDLLRTSPARRTLLEAIGIGAADSEGPYQCQLQVQRASPDWPAGDSRRLLVLHGGPRLEVINRPEGHLSGRADAVIVTGTALVAIESKIDNVVSIGQVERHCKTLDLDSEEYLDLTWSDLGRSIGSIPAHERSDPLVDFVLGQFEEYLQMNGFGGLTHEHFAYFAHTPERRDPLVKDGIRRALSAMASTVVADTGTHWETHVMHVRSDAPDAGVLIQPVSTRKEPHLTIGIDVSGVLIMANVELQHAHRAFMRAWKRDSQGLIQIIRHLGSALVRSGNDVPWRFRVLRRVPLGPPRKFHYWTSSDVATNVMAEWRDGDIHSYVDSVAGQPKDEAAPEITLTRSYTIPQVMQSDDMARRLSSDASEVAPFFDWIGQPFLPISSYDSC